jgi:hypothetical protein
MSDELQARVNLLERELAQAATALQTVHPIGQVKAIGLREVGLAAEQVAEMLATAEARIAELEREITANKRAAIANLYDAIVTFSTFAIAVDEKDTARAKDAQLELASMGWKVEINSNHPRSRTKRGPQ